MKQVDLHQIGCRAYARVAQNAMRHMDLETDLTPKDQNSLQTEQVRDLLRDAMLDISKLAKAAVKSFDGREPYAEHSPWHERKDGLGIGPSGGPKGVTDLAADKAVACIAGTALYTAHGKDLTTEVAIYQGTFAVLSMLGSMTTPAVGAAAARLLELHSWRLHHDNDFVQGDKPQMSREQMRSAGDALLQSGVRALKRVARELDDPTALNVLSTSTDPYNQLAALTAAMPPAPPQNAPSN
jgi:hypothetical protein